MKVQIAVVKLVLRTNKTLADGSHPIMLRCSFNGRKEVSTSYSCPLKFWDKRNECIKKGFPNYLTINSIITKQKMEAIERRDEYERLGIAYTPSMVLSSKEVLSAPKNDLRGLIDQYTKSVSSSTRRVWNSFFNSFKEYLGRDNICVNEISLETIKGYAKHLESKMKDSTIKMTLSKLAAILKYAVEEGIIDESPFKRFNYGKRYKLDSSTDYVHYRSIEVMKEMFLDEVIVRTSDTTWTYNDAAIEQLLNRKSDLFARYFYLCGILFCGLAPIDLCQLKVKDLLVKDINGEDYYSWDGKRQKTHMSVKIRIKVHCMYSQVMINTMLMFRRGTYFLPILDGCENEDSLKIYKKVSNWLSNNRKKLRKWVKEVNAEIIRRNVENHSDIPLIKEDISYYSYRHSYSQMYLAKGGNVLALATILGRSMDTISTYVEQLSEEADLAEAVSVVE